MTEPLFSMPAAGARWILVLVGVFLLIDFIVVAALIAVDDVPLWVPLMITAEILFVLALISCVIPRRYELSREALTLVFAPFRWRIPLETIEGARPAKPWMPYAYSGVRFATAPSRAVEIRRIRRSFTRPNLIVSPADRDEFVWRMNKAIQRWRASAGQD